MSLNRDFVEFIACLNGRGVEYLLVGGYAVAFHGRPRFTNDIGFWVRADPDNAQRVLAAIEDFGFGGLGLKPDDFSTPGRVVQLGVAPARLDIMTSIDGVEFAAAWPRRVESKHGETRLLVIHRDDLARNKKASGRPQDLIDLDTL